MTSARQGAIAFGALILAAGVCIETASSALWSKQPELEPANVAEVRNGYRAGWLVGHDVFNDRSEMIGTITELVLSQDYALFAVVEVGGFLGLDAHLVAVPIRAIVIDKPKGSVVLPGATRKALQSFPAFRLPG